MPTFKVYGHFSSLWQPNGDMVVPTSLTSRPKRRSREKELAKRSALIEALSGLTGLPYRATVAKSFDGTQRRWSGVKENGPDD
jgi:hypothetical protein